DRVARGETGGGGAIVVGDGGGPWVVVGERVRVRRPGPGGARLRQTAIGVNYLDVRLRLGPNGLLKPPATPGVEAAGEVMEVGEGVSHILPGDRVAYACLPVGSYAAIRTLAAHQLVVLPAGLDDETPAAA